MECRESLSCQLPQAMALQFLPPMEMTGTFVNAVQYQVKICNPWLVGGVHMWASLRMTDYGSHRSGLPRA
eukprot:1532539-Amphidinium_carterae.1